MVVTSNMYRFHWVNFYKEFANSLLEYKYDREELINKIKGVYEETEIKFPTLEEKGTELVDIDPFTIFGLFNKKITQSNRTKLLTAIADSFNIKSFVPRSFESIPVLNVLNATFYNFSGDRDENQIDNLWGLFEYALAYENEQTEENYNNLVKYFDLAIDIKWNGTSKITMGLYWIAPDFYMNLDSRNSWFIYESGRIPKKISDTLPAVEDKISAEKYFEIVSIMQKYLDSGESEFSSFNELSYEAWRYSEEVNKKRKEEKLKEKTDSEIVDESVETIRYWMYSPGYNASNWDEFYENGIMAIGWDEIGDLKQFSSKEDISQHFQGVNDSTSSYKNDALALWQFANDIKPGDIVYAKKGVNIIVGRGVVESDYEYDASRDYSKNVRKINWTEEGEWEVSQRQAQKVLTDITKYSDFIKDLNCLIENTFKDNDEELLGENLLLYGVPGVGKSYIIENEYIKDQSRMERVIFHPDYLYSDFVGQIMPTIEKKDDGSEVIRYSFRKGPFTNILKRANEDENKNNMYYLVIEEINRGNAPAIFGDIFQLLDRDENGESEFPITNYDIAREVYGDENEKVILPSNLTILATMNTADQNVFTLDTAFQRRWNMELIPNNFDDKRHEEQYGVEIEDEICWGDFAKAINEKIVENSKEQMGFSDKRMGVYFILANDLTDKDKFANKVLKYLWDDAFKLNPQKVFSSDYDTLEQVLESYCNEGKKLERILQEDIYDSIVNNSSSDEEEDIFLEEDEG